jgi:hypothetical protein
VLGAGVLVVLASVLLIVGGFTANTAAGEDGQPAAVLGAVGLCFGAVVLLIGGLARKVTAKAQQ